MNKFVRPKPCYTRHTKQKWLVGTRVRVTKMMEPALKDVPKHRLTATGIISNVSIKFARTPSMRSVVYEVTLDSEILSCDVINVVPGQDSLELEVLAEKQDDLSPCTGCGDPVHGVPEGLALCETCAKQGEETA